MKKLDTFAVCVLDPNDTRRLEYLTAVTFAENVHHAINRVRKLYPDSRKEALYALPLTDSRAVTMIERQGFTVAEAVAQFASIETDLMLAALRSRRRKRKATRARAVNVAAEAKVAAPDLTVDAPHAEAERRGRKPKAPKHAEPAAVRAEPTTAGEVLSAVAGGAEVSVSPKLAADVIADLKRRGVQVTSAAAEDAALVEKAITALAADLKAGRRPAGTAADLAGESTRAKGLRIDPFKVKSERAEAEAKAAAVKAAAAETVAEAKAKPKATGAAARLKAAAAAEAAKPKRKSAPKAAARKRA